MAQDSTGWFGKLSAAGATIMSALYVLDATGVADSILSRSHTRDVAALATVGALALRFGNDPTNH